MGGAPKRKSDRSLSKSEGQKSKKSKHKTVLKSPRSEPSMNRKSSSKKLQRGLTPPEDTPVLKEEPDKEPKSSDRNKNTFKDNYKGKAQENEEKSRPDVENKPEGVEKSPGTGVEGAFKPEQTPFLMEQRQKTAIRGEALKRIPTITLIFLALELAICLVTLTVWSALGDNPPMPLVLAIVNLLITFLIITFVFFVEVCRMQVKETGTDVNARYIVPYVWKLALCSAHMCRTILVCANLTIVAFDNDFDPGSITMLAVQPVMLLMSVFHLVLAIRPRRDR
ncbi:unnamed protein product [Caenorhabditis auriculariae]|uniref:Uncharacterized protein n=1 Tax=Caenorhabditis auriculariae TaxID=2777116 RepID=A0A8S1HKT8_9PELO|nr:unnamed protein product [Caenorhabditis auriculariae]